ALLVRCMRRFGRWFLVFAPGLGSSAPKGLWRTGITKYYKRQIANAIGGVLGGQFCYSVYPKQSQDRSNRQNSSMHPDRSSQTRPPHKAWSAWGVPRFTLKRPAVSSH